MEGLHDILQKNYFRRSVENERRVLEARDKQKGEKVNFGARVEKLEEEEGLDFPTTCTEMAFPQSLKVRLWRQLIKASQLDALK